MPPRDETGILDAILASRPRPAPRIVEPVVVRRLPPPPTAKAIGRVIETVSRYSGVSVPAIRGHAQPAKICHARSCIAVLAAEFAPRISLKAVDDAMNRGEGITHYYRGRHNDRCKLFPEYAALYRACRASLLGAM